MTPARLRVLLIEDDEDDFVLTRDLLYEMGHTESSIRWESTFEEGLQALQQEQYDVCLLDYQLGSRDGMSLLGEAGTGPLHTPIIFLTGQDSRDLDLKAMQAGASDYLVKGKVDGGLLERSIRYALERQRLLGEMHRRSLIDELTGLLNRRGFEEQGTRQLQLAARRNQQVVLLYADLDSFKSVNDRWGHDEGDRALVETAELIRDSFRRSDLLARIGGDEFVMIPIDSPPPHHATPQQRLLENIRRRNASTVQPYSLSLSIGSTVYDPEHPVALWELVKRADADMFREKAALR